MSGGYCAFRDRKVAAPLKLPAGGGACARGLAFRDRKVAAPLKRHVGRTPEARGAIPRPKGRGPIEATAAATWNTAAPTFRDRKVAAPLKLALHAGGAEHLDRIPRPKGRGPIEAV